MSFISSFSSGPTRKNPHWSLKKLEGAIHGRSHRSDVALNKLEALTLKTRTLLEAPEDFHFAIMPGSATGAIEAALWQLLGPRHVIAHSIDIFSNIWASNVVDELKIPATVYQSTHEHFLELEHDPEKDLLLTLNGTTSGIMYPHMDWIKKDREGLVMMDLTSAAFCLPLDWEKIDVAGFSWQKGLGSEAAHGMLALSPRALERLAAYTPSWPVPRLFKLKNNDKINHGAFKGVTLNTPSMLCVEDYLVALEWAENIGGSEELYQRTLENFSIIENFIKNSSLFAFSTEQYDCVSRVSPCLINKNLADLNLPEKWAWYKRIGKMIEDEGLAYDFVNHALSIPAFRLWCGPTMNPNDIKKLLERIHIEALRD